MQVTKEITQPTKVTLTIVAQQDELDAIKQTVLKGLAKEMKLQGFRPGKAPMAMVEKNIDPSRLQQEFLEQAVNDLYVSAIEKESVRPVAQPEINIVKFVPFTTLELTAIVDAVGDITLGKYKKLNIKKDASKVTDKQVDEIIEDLRARAGSREEVKRAAKAGDEAVIDFAGTDPKSKKPIANTEGTDYTLVLGSGNFIPGFEEEITGLKAGDEKSFDITFPDDYGVTEMQSKKVTFKVTVHKVQAVVLPKIDDQFAAQVGPFKTVDELRGDIRRELTAQQDRDNERKLENQLLEAIAKTTEVAIPEALVADEVERIEQQERQDVLYRGQTWQEHLESEGVTEEEHKDRNRQPAELRVKSGLILGTIAQQENVKVSPEELEVRIQLLKGQYANDERMLAELDKPENRRDIMSRLMTEKTLDALKALQ